MFVIGTYTMGVYLIFIDTSGDTAGLGTGNLIELTSLSNYTIFGILLAIAGVIFPLFTTISIIARPTLSWPKLLSMYDNYYWTYSFALYSNYIFLFISAFHIILREGSSMILPFIILASTCSIIILNTPENQKFFAKKSKRSRTLNQLTNS